MGKRMTNGTSGTFLHETSDADPDRSAINANQMSRKVYVTVRNVAIRKSAATAIPTASPPARMLERIASFDGKPENMGIPEREAPQMRQTPKVTGRAFRSPTRLRQYLTSYVSPVLSFTCNCDWMI